MAFVCLTKWQPEHTEIDPWWKARRKENWWERMPRRFICGECMEKGYRISGAIHLVPNRYRHLPFVVYWLTDGFPQSFFYLFLSNCNFLLVANAFDFSNFLSIQFDHFNSIQPFHVACSLAIPPEPLNKHSCHISNGNVNGTVIDQAVTSYAYLFHGKLKLFSNCRSRREKSPKNIQEKPTPAVSPRRQNVSFSRKPCHDQSRES